MFRIFFKPVIKVAKETGLVLTTSLFVHGTYLATSSVSKHYANFKNTLFISSAVGNSKFFNNNYIKDDLKDDSYIEGLGLSN